MHLSLKVIMLSRFSLHSQICRKISDQIASWNTVVISTIISSSPAALKLDMIRKMTSEDRYYMILFIFIILSTREREEEEERERETPKHCSVLAIVGGRD